MFQADISQLIVIKLVVIMLDKRVKRVEIMLEQESEFVVQIRVRRGFMGRMWDVRVEESDCSFLGLKGVEEVLDQLA